MIYSGINIALGTTYGTILEAPPYNWAASIVSVANTGQIVVAIVALPLLGSGSDKIIKWFARRNNGIHEPEYRLVPLVIPIVVGVLSATFYGLAAQHPFVSISHDAYEQKKLCMLTFQIGVPLVRYSIRPVGILLRLRWRKPNMHCLRLGLISHALRPGTSRHLRPQRHNVVRNQLCRCSVY